MKPRRTRRSKSMRRKTLKRGKPRNTRNLRKSRWLRRGGATCDDTNQRMYDHVMTFPYAK